MKWPLNLPKQEEVDQFPVGSCLASMIEVTASNVQLARRMKQVLFPLEYVSLDDLVFRPRYVIGCGFPFVPSLARTRLLVFRSPMLRAADLLEFQWPAELNVRTLPRYRVVLERVPDGEE